MATFITEVTPEQADACRIWRWSERDERAALRSCDWRGVGYDSWQQRTLYRGVWCCPWGVLSATMYQARGFVWAGEGSNPDAGEIVALLAGRVIDSYAIVLDDDHLRAVLAEVEGEAAAFIHAWDTGLVDPPTLLAFLDRLDAEGVAPSRAGAPLLATA